MDADEAFLNCSGVTVVAPEPALLRAVDGSI
jgi:hypothetical protein